MLADHEDYLELVKISIRKFDSILSSAPNLQNFIGLHHILIICNVFQDRIQKVIPGYIIMTEDRRERSYIFFY